MSELDREIARWRQAMTEGGFGDPLVLDELECHLRDHITAQLRAGRSVADAFREGVERVGEAGALRREFVRADRREWLAGLLALVADGRKVFWVAATASVLGTGGYYGREALTTPVYESVAHVRLLPALDSNADAPRPSGEREIRTGAEIASVLRSLTSERLRLRVSASLTPAEQRIVRRTVANVAVGETPEGVDLGTLRVISWRHSRDVSVLVQHEDAEAAALIANRYVEQCARELGDPTDRDRMLLRMVDPAVSARHPIAPDLPGIRLTAILVGLGMFAGLLAIAGLLRTARRPRLTGCSPAGA